MTPRSDLRAALSGLTIDRLESFLVVADAGGIARAAPQNPSRQSQLSRQLREVSEALGFELMVREGRGMALTDAGRRVRAVLSELVVGLAAVRSASRGEPVAATLVAGESVLRWLVLPTLHEVLAEAPGVELSVRGVTQGYALVRDGDADLALSRTRRHEDGMLTRPVGTLRYQLFVPHALGCDARDLAAVAALPFVHVTGAPEAMAQYAATLGRAPRVALRCESFPQAAQVVAAGRWAALLPTVAARDIPHGVASAAALPGLSALDLKLSLVARERRVASSPALGPLFHALAARLRETLRAQGTPRDFPDATRGRKRLQTPTP